MGKWNKTTQIITGGLVAITLGLGSARIFLEILDSKEINQNKIEISETVGIADKVNITCMYKNKSLIKRMEVQRLFGEDFEMEYGAFDAKIRDTTGIVSKRDYKFDPHLSSHMNQTRESLATKVEKDETQEEAVQRVRINEETFYRHDGPEAFFKKADKLWEEYWNKADGNQLIEEWKFFNSPKQQEARKRKECMDAL